MLYSCWRPSCHVCTCCTLPSTLTKIWASILICESSARYTAAFDGEFGFLYLLSMLMSRQEVTRYSVVSWKLKEDGLCAPNGVAELEALRATMPQKPWTVCCQGWPCLLHLFTSFWVSGWIRRNEIVEIWWEKGEGFSLQLWTLIICIYATVNFQMAWCSVIFQCSAPFGEFSWGTMKHIWICIPS